MKKTIEKFLTSVPPEHKQLLEQSTALDRHRVISIHVDTFNQTIASSQSTFDNPSQEALAAFLSNNKAIATGYLKKLHNGPFNLEQSQPIFTFSKDPLTIGINNLLCTNPQNFTSYHQLCMIFTQTSEINQWKVSLCSTEWSKEKTALQPPDLQALNPLKTNFENSPTLTRLLTERINNPLAHQITSCGLLSPTTISAPKRDPSAYTDDSFVCSPNTIKETFGNLKDREFFLDKHFTPFVLSSLPNNPSSDKITYKEAFVLSHKEGKKGPCSGTPLFYDSEDEKTKTMYILLSMDDKIFEIGCDLTTVIQDGVLESVSIVTGFYIEWRKTKEKHPLVIQLSSLS